jgi:antitoxin component YwqK of YwqJK toxin-antitoxin module
MSRINPDSMVINISKMASDAQVMISFQKGKFNLKGMKNFKTIKGVPNFQKEDQHPPKTNLKLDSTAYFTNGKTKAIYYKVAPNYPLHYVQEFDSVNPNSYAHGYQVIQPTAHSWMPKQTPIWKSAYQNKSGYWEYIKNGKRTKLEMWASLLKEKYEWYPSGQLKKVTRYSAAHLVLKHTYYNPKGLILEEYTAKTKRQNASLKIYSYSSTGQLIMASTYHSSNGIIPQGLQKRTIYYPTGQLKMEENFVGSYSIKYYSKDGKEVQK